MHVEYAQVPPPEDSADRIFITENAVIVLDGASAFVPVPVSPRDYAEHLGRRLIDQLRDRPDIDLREALTRAIHNTAVNLELQKSMSPSATVAILRQRAESYDMLVLGDSPIFWGKDHTSSTLTDHRLRDLAIPQRDLYKDRLRLGHGYDPTHQSLLRELQYEQVRYRNAPDGYWIAESDPDAAQHAVTQVVTLDEASWYLLATDGAIGAIPYLTPSEMLEFCQQRELNPMKVIEYIHKWEHTRDSRGLTYPRSKLSDDKALAFVTTQQEMYELKDALAHIYENLRVEPK